MKDHASHNSHIAGFTLIELLVVIAIIGVLASVVLSASVAAKQRGQDASMITSMVQLRDALELYATNNGGKVLGEKHDSSCTGCLLIDDEAGTDLTSNFTGLIPKYLAVLPKSPLWPNNDVSPVGYVFGYTTYPSDYTFPGSVWGEALTCGRNKITRYAIYFLDNDRSLSLPHFEVTFDYVTYYDYWNGTASASPNYPGGTYCLSF